MPFFPLDLDDIFEKMIKIVVQDAEREGERERKIEIMMDDMDFCSMNCFSMKFSAWHFNDILKRFVFFLFMREKNLNK